MPRRSRYRSRRTMHDQFIRNLEREGERILKRLTEEFVSNIQKEAGVALENILKPKGGGFAFGGDTMGLARIISSGIGYLFSRPRTTRTTAETKRSKDYEEVFRLSRGQAMAETNSTLSKGGKNT